MQRIFRTTLESKSMPEVTPEIIRDTREKLNLSRPVFAHELHVSPRTLEKWELIPKMFVEKRDGKQVLTFEIKAEKGPRNFQLRDPISVLTNP